MKVVAFNGSPRKEGNTASLIKHVLAELDKEGIETEIVQIGGKSVHGCTACSKCFENRDRRCVIDNDIVNECIEKMLEADGIILASPTYFADLTPELKALIDRAGFVAKANSEMFSYKVGAAVGAGRRAGPIHIIRLPLPFLLDFPKIRQGQCCWNYSYGCSS